MIDASLSRQTHKKKIIIKKKTFFNFFFNFKMAHFLAPGLVRQVNELDWPRMKIKHFSRVSLLGISLVSCKICFIHWTIMDSTIVMKERGDGEGGGGGGGG